MNTITKCLVVALLTAPACSSDVDDLSSGKLDHAGSAGVAGATPQTGGTGARSGSSGAGGEAGAGAAGSGGMGGAAGATAGASGSSGSAAAGTAGTDGAGGSAAGAAGSAGAGLGGAAGSSPAGAGGAAGTTTGGAGGAAGATTAGTGGVSGSTAGTAGSSGSAGTGGSPPTCGNGVVEVGEECDLTGIPPAGAPPCNPTTCRRDCTGELRYRDAPSGACFFVANANTGPSSTYTWAEANTACTSLGAHLATFEDAALRSRIAARNWDNGQLWVGGKQDAGSFAKKADEGWFWQTPTGPIAIAPSAWRNGEPNDGISLPFDNGNQDCAHVYPTDDFRLDDVGCNTKRPALCVTSPKQ